MRSDNLLFWYLLLTVFAFGCSSGDTLITPTSEPPPSQFQGLSGPSISAAQPPGVQQDEPGEPPQPCGDPPSPQSYLGGGHPIEGVNARRNNRSSHLLPTSLSSGEVLDEIFGAYSYQDPLGGGGSKSTYNALVFGPDENLYIGNYGSGGGSVAEYSDGGDGYSLLSGSFDEFKADIESTTSGRGGWDVVLMAQTVCTTSNRDSSWSRHLVNPISWLDYIWGEDHKSYLCKYDDWPNTTAEIEEYWGKYCYTNKGDWSGRRFDKVFPLPNGTYIISYAKPSLPDSPEYVQLLDEEFNVLREHSFDQDIVGFAYDEDYEQIYVTTYVGYSKAVLYCMGPALEPKWDTIALWDRFNNDLPVINDEGGILGQSKGCLKRVDPSGGGIEVTGAYWTRPAILNDGSIAIIGDSHIKLLDTQLNQTDGIPLPTGFNTGKFYKHPPLVDASDNIALIMGKHLYIIDKYGNELAHHEFEDKIRNIRLGPEHLFVALDEAIYRFES